MYAESSKNNSILYIFTETLPNNTYDNMVTHSVVSVASQNNNAFQLHVCTFKEIYAEYI